MEGGRCIKEVLQSSTVTANMGSGRRMCDTQLWLLALLTFFSVISLTDGSPMKVMSAPNLLRVGTPENIFVECQDCTNENDFMVDINVMNYPTKSKRLVTTSVNLTSTNKYQGFGQIMIPPADFKRDPNMRQYVYLQAHFPDVKLEKVVLVTFHSGYIFIQTDKILYTPSSKVHFRVFGLTPRLEPVEKNDETRPDAFINIEFVTPEGIILSRDPVFLKSGIYSGDFQLGEIVSIGLWKVVARFHTKPQTNFSAEFEVKDYVLPSFEVKLMHQSPFFYVSSPELTVNIKATYLFGEEVDGSAYGVFGVKHQGQKRSFPSSLQRVLIENGEGKVTLKKEHITQIFENILDLVGSSIYVAVSVLTGSGSEMAEAELQNIQIVTSPYTVHFKKTPRYFKPGLSFDVVIGVMNPDDTPARGVLVVVEPGEVEGITGANGMARLTVNTVENSQALVITVKTKDPRISPERQASANMTALPYSSNSNNYIHIGIDATEVSPGENLKMNLNFNKQSNEQTDITYLILSRGQLVSYGRYKARGQLLISVMVTISKEMLPSFRIIAYYHPSDTEVVSDSVWVDVKESCMGLLKLEPSKPAASYMPRKMFQLKVTGDPEAIVGLVAVDKGVYTLNNKHRLTQKKIWAMVDKSDTGCTPGGGKDSMSVFSDAGLLFETNLGSGTPYRQELNCPAPSRKKRDAALMNITTSLLSQYDEELQRDCCLDGMRETPVSYSCERRSEYILDGAACAMAFLNCCREMERIRGEKREGSLQLARSEEDDTSYMDSSNIVSRTNFPESWLWSDIKLPACHQPNCVSTIFEKTVPLQDSITTWQFTGISLSRSYGICVADPLEIIVRKDFFVELKLPFAAVRGEQLEIKAVIHNYSPNLLTVRVELKEEADLCSAASRRGKYEEEVEVEAGSARAVPFVIIPTKEGKHKIDVKAAIRDSNISDGIMKMLRVVPEGILIKTPQIITLDPATKGLDGKQVEIINSKIPQRDFVPNAPTSTQITLTGKKENVVKNAITGESMGALIYTPSGCGEENMMHMTHTVIATMYLDKTNQWEPVGIDRRGEALQHISTGYQNQLAYRKQDGSFSRDHDNESSTWLTAYVVKVLTMASSLVAVKSEVICDAVKFLIVNTQQPNGVFREVGGIYHREMTGNVYGTDSDASMTAFCVIAMQESRTTCAATVNRLSASIDKAATYLRKRQHSLMNPYAVAITSYALANENKLNHEILYKYSSPDFSHWPTPTGRQHTLEATAYALLALVKVKAFEDARPLVRWFNRQIRQRGGYGSTQSTMAVYQAVTEYWFSDKESDYFLNVDILLPGRTRPDKYNFNWENHYATRTSKINDINQDVKVTATGKGEATLTMVSLYYALPTERDSDCQKFNLSVQLVPEKLEKDENIYKLKIEVLYKDKKRDATMTVLDIGFLTGFVVNTKDLNLLSKGRARTIAKYRMDSVQSERGSLIIYLDKVSHTRPEEIIFRIHQKLKVGVLQPAAVSVYEYTSSQYRSEANCMKFYHPERRAGELLRLCRNDECTCAEENCSMQKKGKVDNSERAEKICETTKASRIDFAYKVRLEKFTDSLSTDIYTVRVLEVIKEGSNDVGPQGKLRPFLSYRHCRAALDLWRGKTYLIMGTAQDIYKDEQSRSYQYVLGERTWIEYWPREAECKTPMYNSTCSGMEEMVQQYTVQGCLH
ncbi:complement C3-like isoform X2 [Amphiprion ocellaris]|uniref:Anaphylatoxin-like domain-containing protein n=1 Tax=Amphiprion ocellaris TaxID=80972 RepID=A0A3Q1BKM2_AMPOC|nr:complement C3-like isoform X2 [Amphiprion ocellaris]